MALCVNVILLYVCRHVRSCDDAGGWKAGVNVAQELADTDSDGDRDEFTRGLITIGVIFVFSEAIYYLATILAARVVTNATARVQSALIDAVLYSGSKFENSYRPGMLTNAFNSGITKLEQIWDLLLFDFALALMMLVSAVVFVGIVDVDFMLIVLAMLTIIASFRTLEAAALSANDKSDASSAHLLGRFQNAVALRRAAKVCNAQKFVYDRVHLGSLVRAKKMNFLTWMYSNALSALFASVGTSISLISNLLFLVALSKGQIDAGEFFSLVSFVQSIPEPIEALGQFSGTVATLSGSVLKINKMLNDARIDDEKFDHYEEVPKLSLDQELVLDNIRFSYNPGKSCEVLKGVSAVIPAGSYVCILGGSGSGKSTLLSLLTGVHRSTEGDIYLDKTAISSVPLRSLRNSLAVVFQETFVFDGTIRDNIAFGQDNLSDEDIITAARDAGIADFIETLEDKYDTVIGKETTVAMSGGQLQRVCGIARALAREPQLLVLDEATSALDAVTEAHFIETVERLRDRGLTVVSVTHHTSTAVNADMILVPDKGIIVENGTYTELTTGNNTGLFAKLVAASGGAFSAAVAEDNAKYGGVGRSKVKFEDDEDDSQSSGSSDSSF